MLRPPLLDGVGRVVVDGEGKLRRYVRVRLLDPLASVHVPAAATGRWCQTKELVCVCLERDTHTER